MFTRFSFLHGIYHSVLPLQPKVGMLQIMTYSGLPTLIDWIITVDTSSEEIMYQGGSLVCLRRGLSALEPVPFPQVHILN